MRELVEILQWREPNDLPILWRGRYETFLEKRISQLANGASGNECILESLKMLAPAQRGKFLRSPKIAARILQAGGSIQLDGAVIAEGLLAELALNNIVEKLPESLWTATGDLLLNPGMTPAARAALLGTEVVVDTSSPTEFSCAAVGVLTHLDEAEKKLAQEKLSQALVALSRISPPAFSFWKESVDVVALRKSASDPERLWSNTSAQEPRLTVLSNVQSKGVTIPLVTESLLHEAIHSSIFMYERIDKALLDQSANNSSKIIVSPWTGKPLRAVSYIHACVVWYGLYWLWSYSMQLDVFEKKCSVAEQNFIARGFGLRPFSLFAKAYPGMLSCEGNQLLESIEQTMVTLK